MIFNGHEREINSSPIFIFFSKYEWRFLIKKEINKYFDVGGRKIKSKEKQRRNKSLSK